MESIGKDDPRLDSNWIRDAPRHPGSAADDWSLSELIEHASRCPNCKLGGTYCYWHKAWIRRYLEGALSLCNSVGQLSEVIGGDLSIVNPSAH